MQGGGRGAHAGLRAGDLVLSICGVATCTLSHSQVKGEMLRAGNDLDLVIQRWVGGVVVIQKWVGGVVVI